ncbi:uncharacterized protein LOC142567769 [Dermacentor variabilis]|uniref:uncharacterized protein LOC142567769 n=1 Tax=Dermacentor variabilis TaxID=34621 RepID=UPI003F5B04DD
MTGGVCLVKWLRHLPITMMLYGASEKLKTTQTSQVQVNMAEEKGKRKEGTTVTKTKCHSRRHHSLCRKEQHMVLQKDLQGWNRQVFRLFHSTRHIMKECMVLQSGLERSHCTRGTFHSALHIMKECMVVLSVLQGSHCSGAFHGVLNVFFATSSGV